MRTTKLGGLTTRIVGGEDGHGGGDGPVVVLCHGFGAGGDDLVPLASELRVDRRIRFAFPEAPHALPAAYGGYGRMWWNIDMAEMERAAMTGIPRDMSEREPPGLIEASGALVEMLDALEDALGVSSAEVLIGGFSQGAMLTCEVALCTSRPLPGLAMLSGTLLARDRWLPAMKTRARLPVFISHGTHDQVLPFAGSEAVVAGFSAASAKVTQVSFRGGHEIPRVVLDGLKAFIHEVLPNAR